MSNAEIHYETRCIFCGFSECRECHPEVVAAMITHYVDYHWPELEWVHATTDNPAARAELFAGYELPDAHDHPKTSHHHE